MKMQKYPTMLRHPLRYSSIIILAVWVNLTLFVLIQLMVSHKDSLLPKIENINLVNFVHFRNELKAAEKILEKEFIDDPPPEESPPPPEMIKPDPVKPQPEEMEFSAPKLDIPLNIGEQPYLGDILKSMASGPKEFDAFEQTKPKVFTNIIPVIKIPPEYPRRALRSGIEGIVTVEFTIDMYGKIKNPTIVKANPPEIFDQAVLNAIKKWQFNTKKENGRAIEIRARQDIRFTLKK